MFGRCNTIDEPSPVMDPQHYHAHNLRLLLLFFFPNWIEFKGLFFRSRHGIGWCKQPVKINQFFPPLWFSRFPVWLVFQVFGGGRRFTHAGDDQSDHPAVHHQVRLLLPAGGWDVALQHQVSAGKAITRDICSEIHTTLSWLIRIAGYGLGYGLGFRSDSCSWQLGLESESNSMQCENYSLCYVAIGFRVRIRVRIRQCK